MSSRSFAPVAARLALAAAVVAIPVATAPLSSSGTAAAAPEGCGRAPDRSLLSTRPAVTELPYGAKLEVWDNHQPGLSTVRISAVIVPPSSKLRLNLYTAGALTRAEAPSDAIKHRPDVVAVSNGDVFDPGRGALPVGDEVLKGTVVKAEGAVENTVSISKSGHSYPGHIQLYGHVSAGGHQERISGLNWQYVTGTGINVYVAPWGPQHHPYGDVTVVVHDGQVRGIHHGSSGSASPGRGDTVLTASGEAGAFLDRLHDGESIDVKYGFHAYGYWPRDHVSKVEYAVHRGAPYWFMGRSWPIPCDSRDETLRPRTAIGWTHTGYMMLIAVTGPASEANGGSTLHNMQYYTGALEKKFGGHFDAETMDGGGSTTLAVRKRMDGPVVRVDRPGAAQRPVPNFLALAP